MNSCSSVSYFMIGILKEIKYLLSYLLLYGLCQSLYLRLPIDFQSTSSNRLKLQSINTRNIVSQMHMTYHRLHLSFFRDDSVLFSNGITSCGSHCLQLERNSYSTITLQCRNMFHVSVDQKCYFQHRFGESHVYSRVWTSFGAWVGSQLIVFLW